MLAWAPVGAAPPLATPLPGSFAFGAALPPVVFAFGAASLPGGAFCAGTAGFAAGPGVGAGPASGGASFWLSSTSCFCSLTLLPTSPCSSEALLLTSPIIDCSQPIGEFEIWPSIFSISWASAAAPCIVDAECVAIAA